jgi:CheY-like chemotaxis protein
MTNGPLPSDLYWPVWLRRPGTLSASGPVRWGDVFDGESGKFHPSLIELSLVGSLYFSKRAVEGKSPQVSSLPLYSFPIVPCEGGMGTILLLEDEPFVAVLIASILKPLGHDILAASTAQEAFRRCKEADSRIDLLIADVNLPVASGIRVALELRSLLPNLRIILSSTYPTDMWNAQHLAELNKLPCDSLAILQKPFLAETLRSMVSRFLTVPATGNGAGKGSFMTEVARA